jgi:hypothetical protein
MRDHVLAFRVSLAIGVTAVVAACAASTGGGGGSSPSSAAPGGGPPGLSEIKEADIRRDIFILGGDGFRGREAGTLDEMRATVWVAEEARKAGLEPAGDDGTYYQWWPMRRTVLSENSRVMVGDSSLRMSRDVMVSTPAASATMATVVVDLPLVFVENALTEAAGQDLTGKAAAAVAKSTAAANTITTNLRARGAGAILIVGDSALDSEETWSALVQARAARGSYGLDSGQAVRPVPAPTANAQLVLRTRKTMLSRVRSAASRNLRLSTNIFAQTFSYPSANVVAVVRGTDPARRDEYVLYSGHQDHDGVRNIINGDSIWNGADDNATVSVAMLAIGRATAKHPMPRSALFVWHGAEERGLLGSRWFVHKPIVPLKQIAAVLNADMIGRNSIDSAALIGWREPYRNSKALATAALNANTSITKFKLDTLWDLPTHCEGWYFRSDHLPYAQARVPAIYFSSLLNGDYHTPEDEPRLINTAKLTKIAQWMYATGWTIGTARDKPDSDPTFVPPRGPGRPNCVNWTRPPTSPPGADTTTTR